MRWSHVFGFGSVNTILLATLGVRNLQLGSRLKFRSSHAIACVVLISCNGSTPPAAQQSAQPAAPPAGSGAAAPAKTAAAPKYDRVKRLEFNRIAQEIYAPIFWTEDKNNDGAI